MDEKQKKQLVEIQLWLKEVLGDYKPSFEVNDTTLSILQNLMERNKMANVNRMCALKEWEESSKFYDKEADRLQRILKNFGISNETLSHGAKGNISCLTSLACSYNVQDPSITNITLAMMEMQDERLKVESCLEDEKRTIEKLEVETERELSILSKLESLNTSLNNEGMEDDIDSKEKLSRTKFLKCKNKEYLEKIVKMKKELASTELVPELKHSHLVKVSEELKKDRKKLSEMKKQLATYNSISPSNSLAKVDLEEARRELESLDAELASKIDLWHS